MASAEDAEFARWCAEMEEMQAEEEQEEVIAAPTSGPTGFIGPIRPPPSAGSSGGPRQPWVDTVEERREREAQRFRFHYLTLGPERPRQPIGGGNNSSNKDAAAQPGPMASAALNQQSSTPGLYFFIIEREMSGLMSREDGDTVLNDSTKRVYWTDASLYQERHRQAAAIAWPEAGHSHKWRVCVLSADVPAGEQGDVDTIELVGIQRSLAEGVKQWDAQDDADKGPDWLLRVYTDSQHCVEDIRRARNDKSMARATDSALARQDLRPQMADTLKAIEQLDRRGAHVELRWIPGHANIWGNTIADAFAGAAARAGSQGITNLQKQYRFREVNAWIENA